MNIPQIKQDLATIKAIHIQVENGYHISEHDFTDFTSAINDINALYHEVARQLEVEEVINLK